MALGVMGLGLDDLERLTPGEFNATREAWEKQEEARSRERWEQARYVSYHSVIPHANRGFRITDLGRFPWEERVFNNKGPVKKLSREDRERMKRKFEDQGKVEPVTSRVPDAFPQESRYPDHDPGDQHDPDKGSRYM